MDVDAIKSEMGLRSLIARNLRKEIHPGTKPSIDFIDKILEEAYLSGMTYDLNDMRGQIIAFANGSTNQALTCLKIVKRMKFKSDEAKLQQTPVGRVDEERIVFFDVEVFPNLFVICWKFQGSDNVVRMINPTAHEVEALFALRLVGFNNRRYDNHMIYAAFMGYNNEQLYRLSKKIIDGVANSLFGEAFNLSYTDVFDYSSVKKGLKWFQISLGIHHQELDIPWDEPVPEELWDKVVEYCVNDVISLEAVHESRKQDWAARQILASLSGLSPNDTTQKHTSKIIFGDDRNPQKSFVYTDLSKNFPGYVFEKGVSTYRGEIVGEGGYVHAEPGMYENVALLDVASMHPTSIKMLDLFGPYTANFVQLMDARLAIKRRDFDLAKSLLDGKLSPFLSDPDSAEGLAYALKIVINIVYGLTSAKFDNAFRDHRNVDNIAAKRGALFMIDLKQFVQDRGFTAAHIKTDSIKIPDATPEIIEEVKLFGEKYGYTFEHEGTYDKFCLVNDAVYIAKQIIPATLNGDNKDAWKRKWTAVGAQFQHPYVFKTLFTHEDITFEDLCETKQVTQGAMYLDFDAVNKSMVEADRQGMHFVGRTGRFVPVEDGYGGGVLYRIKDEKKYAVTGTKNYLWLEAELAKDMGEALEVDLRYFEKLVYDARDAIDYFGPFATFVE